MVNEDLRIYKENPRYILLQGPISFGLSSEGRRRRFEVYHKVAQYKRGSNEFKIQWRQNGINEEFFSSGELNFKHWPTRISYAHSLQTLPQRVFVPWIQAFCEVALIEMHELAKQPLIIRNSSLKNRGFEVFYLSEINDDDLESRDSFYLEQIEFLRDLALTCRRCPWTKNYQYQYEIDFQPLYRPCWLGNRDLAAGFILCSGLIDQACRC